MGLVHHLWFSSARLWLTIVNMPENRGRVKKPGESISTCLVFPSTQGDTGGVCGVQKHPAPSSKQAMASEQRICVETEGKKEGGLSPVQVPGQRMSVLAAVLIPKAEE